MYLLKAYGAVGTEEYGEDASDLTVGIVFHDPRSDDPRYLVKDPKLDWQLGRSGTLSFTMYDKHRSYDTITPLKTYISVHYFLNDSELSTNPDYWRGRVVSIEKKMNGALAVTCEGIMSCLSDVEYVADYYETQTTVPETVYPTDIMAQALECYNHEITRTPNDFSECCREFIFVPINIGEQETINPYTYIDNTTTNETVWSKIDSLTNDENGYLRSEYSATFNKYVLFYTTTNFNFPANASTFSTTTAYSIGDCVVYNNTKYVFFKPHSAGAWNNTQVIEYTTYDGQNVELSVNLVDIVRKTNVSDLYSHLKAYGNDIEYLDIFEDMKVSTVGGTFQSTATINVQKNKWYRYPVAWYKRNDESSGQLYNVYADIVPTIAALDNEGNVVPDYTLPLTNYYNNTLGYIETPQSINDLSWVYFAINPGIVETAFSTISYYYFQYRSGQDTGGVYTPGPALPAGSHVTINCVAGTYRPSSVTIGTFTFNVSASGTTPTGVSIGTAIRNLPGSAYGYIEPITNENVHSLKFLYSVYSTHYPVQQKHPAGNNNAKLTPSGVPLDYEFLGTFSYPSGLIDSNIFNTFGRINKIENYNDVLDRDELLAIAEDKVALDIQQSYSATIKALDLSNLYSLYAPFYPGFIYTIKPYSTLVDQASLLCNKITIPLTNIKSSEYVFGVAPDTITERQYINGYWRRKNS